MLKSVLYYLLLLTTAIRFIDIIYLLAKDSTNLPMPVLVVTTAMILYGVVLVVKKIVGNVRLKQLATFYLVQTVMIVFNLSFVAFVSPLKVNALETLVVGTFLDLLVNGAILYFCNKQMRSSFASVQR